MNEGRQPEDESAKLDFKSVHIDKEWKHDAPLIGCRFDPSGRFVFSTSMDQNLQRWNLEDGQKVALSGHESWLRAIGFSKDGNRAFTAGYDGRLCFWDNESQSTEPLKTIDAHHGWVRWLSVSPDGKLIATAGNDLVVRIWNSNSGDLLHELKGHQKHIYSLFFHPAGNFLASGDLEGKIHIWETNQFGKTRTLEAKALHTYHTGQKVDYGGVRCMDLSKDGTELACGGLHKGTNPFAGVQEPLVVVLNWQTGDEIRTHEATQISHGILWRLHYLQDGTLMGASGGGTGGFLVFWGKEEKTDVHKFKLPNTVLDMDYAPDSLTVAAAHHDGRLTLSRLTEKA